MPVLIRKKPSTPSLASTPPLNCDSVEERLRNGASPSSTSEEEWKALKKRDAIKLKGRNRRAHHSGDAWHNDSDVTALAQLRIRASSARTADQIQPSRGRGVGCQAWSG